MERMLMLMLPAEIRVLPVCSRHVEFSTYDLVREYIYYVYQANC